MKTSINISLLIFAGLLWAGSAKSADRCDCDSEVRDKIDSYDALLRLSASKQASAQSRHTIWGLPTAPASATQEQLLVQKDYLIWYDGDLRVPLWVSYRLKKSDLKTHRERLQCFRLDPRLDPAVVGTCDDYDEPIYERGHLVPNGDMERTEAAMLNTYLFSNMTPQFPSFNKGVWERLEGMVRDWARVKGKIYVISGSIFDKNNDGQRDADADANHIAPNKPVAIPTHFYKIIVRNPTLAQADAIAILLPHDQTKHLGAEAVPYLTQHITTIKHIEDLTGITFFPTLAAAKRTALENAQASALWPTH